MSKASGTACTTIAAACANAGTGTAAAIASVATSAAVKVIIFIIQICVTAIAAIAAVGSIAARGIQRAATEEVKRVALRQLDASTAAHLSVGMGSRAGDGHAIGHVEIHSAQDGQAAAANRGIAERKVRAGVVVRRATCCAERLSRRGPLSKLCPICRIGLRNCIDFIPTGLRPRSLHDGAEQGKNA